MYVCTPQILIKLPLMSLKGYHVFIPPDFADIHVSLPGNKTDRMDNYLFTNYSMIGIFTVSTVVGIFHL